MPADAPGAAPGWAFCSVCGTLLTTEEPSTLAAAPPQAARPRPKLTYAEFWRRFAGWSIDYLLVLVAVLIVVVAAEFVIAASGANFSERRRLVLNYALLLPVSAVYYVVFNATGGTLGKQALGR
jgi:uncharacterized RDD family membrane protein YckC